MMATRPLPEWRKSVSRITELLPVRQQADRERTAVTHLLAATTADQLTIPRRWVEALLRPMGAAILADDGLAKTAAEAARLVSLSPSRLTRLAHEGFAPGAYREPGARGRWMFPIPSLRALQAAIQRGAHRNAGGHGGAP
jgi:hypothetical protein